jgi:hypothetical protein
MSLNMGWTVRCDYTTRDGYICYTEDQTSGTKKMAKEDFKASGWTYKHKQWLCPHCSKQEGIKKALQEPLLKKPTGRHIG